MDTGFERGSAEPSPIYPPSPRSRLVKNVVDTKLVRNLAKCQRFSIGSLRIYRTWLCCFFLYASITVNIQVSYLLLNKDMSKYA